MSKCEGEHQCTENPWKTATIPGNLTEAAGAQVAKKGHVSLWSSPRGQQHPPQWPRSERASSRKPEEGWSHSLLQNYLVSDLATEYAAHCKLRDQNGRETNPLISGSRWFSGPSWPKEQKKGVTLIGRTQLHFQLSQGGDFLNWNEPALTLLYLPSPPQQWHPNAWGPLSWRGSWVHGLEHKVNNPIQCLTISLTSVTNLTSNSSSKQPGTPWNHNTATCAASRGYSAGPKL